MASSHKDDLIAQSGLENSPASSTRETEDDGLFLWSTVPRQAVAGFGASQVVSTKSAPETVQPLSTSINEALLRENGALRHAMARASTLLNAALEIRGTTTPNNQAQPSHAHDENKVADTVDTIFPTTAEHTHTTSANALAETGPLDIDAAEALRLEKHALQDILEITVSRAAKGRVALEDLRDIVRISEIRLFEEIQDPRNPRVTGIFAKINKDLFPDWSADAVIPPWRPKREWEHGDSIDEVVAFWRFQGDFGPCDMEHIMDELKASVSVVIGEMCEIPISAEVATSEAKVLEAVSPDFMTLVADRDRARDVLVSATWRFLIREVFEKPSCIWMGPDGEAFDRICWRLREEISALPDARATLELRRFHELRARLALQLVPFNPPFGKTSCARTMQAKSAVLNFLKPFLKQELKSESMESMIGKMYYDFLLRNIADFQRTCRMSRVWYQLSMSPTLEKPHETYDLAFDREVMNIEGRSSRYERYGIPQGARVLFISVPKLVCWGEGMFFTWPVMDLDKPIVLNNVWAVVEGEP